MHRQRSLNHSRQEAGIISVLTVKLSLDGRLNLWEVKKWII